MANPGTTEFIDTTTAASFIPEIWAMLTTVAREANLVWANLVDRRFEKELKFGDILHVSPVTSLGTAQTKSTNTAITYETATETNVDITVNTHEYSAMAVEDIVKVQANRDVLAVYTGKRGYQLALAVDDAMAGLPDDVTNTVGALGTENTDDDFIRARQYLNDANAPRTERYIVVSPAAESGMLKLDRFVHADYQAVHGTNDAEGGLQEAYMGTYYRMPIYVSTNTEGSNSAGHDNSMHHKHAFTLLMQMQPTAHAQFDIDYLCDKVALVQLYGYREMRDDHGVWVKGA